MGPYRGYLWCELHLPSNVITGVIMISVFVEHFAGCTHMGAQ